MKRLIPDTIAARTLLVLILGLALSHTISVALYITDRNDTLALNGGDHIGDHIVTIDRRIREAPEADRQRLVELAGELGLRVTLTPQSAIDDELQNDSPSGPVRNALVARLGGNGERAIRMQHMGMMAADPRNIASSTSLLGEAMVETMMISLPLSGSGWLNFTTPIEIAEPFWSLRFGLSMAVMLSAVAILSAIVVHYLTRPLAAFAHAAERLGVDVKAPPLAEDGPFEVRQATRAFNEMQARIRRFVEDRTQMIAAISHDLGTPITRMRLRAEFVEDEEQQRKMLADLDDMEKMVFSALSFARDESVQEPQESVDLRTILQRICDDAGDAGHSVTLDVGDRAVPYNCRPVALRRALSNLIDNAAKYGHQARVSLVDEMDAVVVVIDDDGPGIAEDRQEDVFKPFHRIEISRSRETGGTGLGLTVARTILRSHGGDVTLHNRDEGGLRVKVRLPRPLSAEQR